MIPEFVVYLWCFMGGSALAFLGVIAGAVSDIRHRLDAADRDAFCAGCDHTHTREARR